MRRIYEVSNEGSPGTKESWYEVAYLVPSDPDNDGGPPYGTHVATFHTRDELEIYLHGLDRCRSLISKDDIGLLRRRHPSLPMGHKHYKYQIIPYHEPNE